jgi:2-polyprenyl-3-methyl-5-hydroxy-6-metoxy-1,4-benzoquinol methylase
MMENVMGEQTRPELACRAARDLARALSKECRGETAVAGRGFPALEEFVQRGHRRAGLCWSGTLDSLLRHPGGFESLVLVRALEYEPQEQAVVRLRQAWKQVRPGGRLVACVPNEDLLEDEAIVQRFSRRSLKKLLQAIDRPRLVTTQPFQWLVMTLDTDQRPSRAARERYRIMAELCRGKVMELGCGPGHLCDAIARCGLEVQGVDKNAGKIAKARELYPEIPFAQADILAMPGGDVHDTVVLAEVLEHVPPEVGGRMLERAWSMVGPGGRLVISVPNEDCVRHPNHLQEFERAGLERMLRPLGVPVVVAGQPFKWLLMYVDRC